MTCCESLGSVAFQLGEHMRSIESDPARTTTLPSFFLKPLNRKPYTAHNTQPLNTNHNPQPLNTKYSPQPLNNNTTPQPLNPENTQHNPEPLKPRHTNTTPIP